MVTQKARSMTIYQTKPPRARWILHLQATFWRVLMGLGMFFHRLAPPRPPKPDFYREIPAQISGKEGIITLHFYVPEDYQSQKQLWQRKGLSPDADEQTDDEDNGGGKGKRRLSTALTNVSQRIRRRSSAARKWGGFPVVINFHGGGFTLGHATDDSRWCSTVVDECHAVVVTVDYRLAPECPFPVAVEDGVDAVVWVHKHAKELGIDREKIALSGFSSGGNMAFTVPLRLYDEQMGFPREGQTEQQSSKGTFDHPFKGDAPASSASSSSTMLPPANGQGVEILDPRKPPPPTPGHLKKADTTITESSLPDINIRCIIPWYPSLDYTRTREQRRVTNIRADHNLPAVFTDLFDESYLHPPATISLDSPYLSPGVAPTALLKNALPHEIIMFTCQWDMLLAESEDFRDRLESEEIGKKVTYRMVEGVPHGWDKAPNPWKPTPGVKEHYLRACKEMRRVFGARVGEDVLTEHRTEHGPSAAARGSVSVVR